jgi:hypothetical protein
MELCSGLKSVRMASHVFLPSLLLNICSTLVTREKSSPFLPKNLHASQLMEEALPEHNNIKQRVLTLMSGKGSA